MIPLEMMAPEPPIDMVVRSALAEWAFLWVNVAICVALVVWAIVVTRQYRTWIPLLCVIGGAITIYLEPLIDAHLQVWWPKHEQPTVVSGWGRELPLLALFVVTWYFGAGVLLRWHWLQKEGPVKWLWTVYAIEVAAALALEPPAIALHLWHYYGEHGLRFFGYPIWWPFVGGACNMLAGTVLWRMTPYLKGWKVILAAPLIPMCVAAVYWGAGWPMFYVLNVEPAHWVVYLVSFSSIGLAFMIVWLCTIATRISITPAKVRPASELARAP
jgi:hypothetical protein